MQSSRTIEIWVGIFVAIGFAALLMLSMKVSHLGNFFADEGYAVTAKFDNIGGLKVKSPVKMGGVRIGRVVDISLNEKHKAVVTMHIERQHNKIPTETTTSIFTAGLLGEQYIGLEAGYSGACDGDVGDSDVGDSEVDDDDLDDDDLDDDDLDDDEACDDDGYLKDGSQLDPGLTQSAVILEQLIGQFLYNTAAGGTTEGNADK
jgi:phospholipid/cholesterol/gamma-HCH transport system substrate-binding protein